MSNKILVVDDDRALQLLLEVLFSRAGFDVDFAGDGKEAMTKIASGVEYQTIVLDLVLPEISGKEILDLLERDRAALLPRVIVLSGASRGILEQIDTSRIHALIRKPFDIQDLLLQAVKCSKAGTEF